MTDFAGGRSRAFQPTITFVEESPPRVPRLDVNTATADELARAPGVTAAVARKIVAARERRLFAHVDDLVTEKVISPAVRGRIGESLAGARATRPNLHTLGTEPERVLNDKPFALRVRFDDSVSGVRLARLQVDSMSHSLDLTREVTPRERKAGVITFELPAMEAGLLEAQATLYDDAGNKDYLARKLHVYHNPAFVIFYPSERSLRLSNGGALKKSDGRFHCNSNFYFYNGTSTSVTLNRNLTWRIFSQSGALLASGTWDFGSNIVLGPWAISTGWWFNFSFPPGNNVFNRLQNKEWIRIEWAFTQLGSGAVVADSLTWRAPLGPHVNIIRVGEENFTATEKTRVFNALRSSAGSIYQQQDLDIGTIRTFIISVAAAGGYVTINSNSEAEDLTEDWTVANDALDMFVVRSYVGSVAGLSPVNGPCDKNAKGMNGNVVELQSSQSVLGVIMAHEIGHYLGLGHTSASGNVMQPSVGSGSTGLTGSQGTTMKKHCFIRFLA